MRDVAIAPQPSQQELAEALRKQLKQQINPLFHIEEVVQVPALPRTASNKIMRRKLRGMHRPCLD